MASYGPQNAEYYAKEKADFDAKIARDEATRRSRRGVPASIISRRSTPEPITAPADEPEVIVETVRTGGSRKSNYITPNYEQHVFIALALALLFTLLAAKTRGDDNRLKPKSSYLDPAADPVKFLVGWVVLFAVLVIMARFRGTDKLAATFAWLIFVSVLLINGEQAYRALPGYHLDTSGVGAGKRAKP